MIIPILQMRTVRPREEKQLATKYVHGRVKAGLPVRAPSLPSSPQLLWMLWVKREGRAHRPGCKTPPPLPSPSLSSPGSLRDSP